MIFKSRYLPVRLANASKRDFARLRAMANLTSAQIAYAIPGFDGNPYDAVQESLWDGMTIRIEPFRGTPEEWFRRVEYIAGTIARQDAKYARRFYEALGAEREYFRTQRLDPQKVSGVTFESVFADIDRRTQAR